MKFGGPLAIIVTTRYNSMWIVAKALYRTWALILFLKLKKYISNDILKVKLKIFPIYNHYEIWWTIFYHRLLHGTI